MNDFRRSGDERSTFDDAASRDREQEDEIELVDENDFGDGGQNARPTRSPAALDRIGLLVGDGMKYFTASEIVERRKNGEISDRSPVWIDDERFPLSDVWNRINRRMEEERREQSRRGDPDVLPPGAFRSVGLLIDGEMKLCTPRELRDCFMRGFVRNGTPVYLNDVQYYGRDFWEQVNQTPTPAYFVVPERTQSPVLLYLLVGFVLSVVVVTTLILILGRETSVSPAPETPPGVVESEPPESEPTEPESTESEATESEPTKPEPTRPEPTRPEPTKSETTEPERTEHEPTESEPTKPESTEPEAMESEPTESEPTESEATEPEATESEPTKPEPTESEPAKPEPTKSEPPKPEATESESTKPEPTESEAAEPEPTTPESATDPFYGQWLDAPFDPNMTKIPSQFRGHNFLAVRNALLRPEFQLPERGVDESDDDYGARVGAAEFRAEKTPLFGTVTPSSRLAFVVPNLAMVRAEPRRYRDSEYVTTQYATATKTLTVSKSLGIFSVSFFDGRYIAPFLLSGGSYGLALESPSEFGFRWANSDSYHWKVVGIPERRYESMKDTICVLCVVIVDYQGLGDVGLLGASGNYALYSREVEFWLYDSASGEILGKFSFDDTLEETPHEYRFGRLSSGVVARKIDKRSAVGSPNRSF